MNIVITPKFEVCGQYFDSIKEAEKYLAEHEDQARVEAYTQYLRDNGAQRINKSVTETVLDFIQFEKGIRIPSPETAAPVVETPEPVAAEEETAAPAEAKAEAQVAEVPSDEEKPPFTPDKPVGKSLFANSDATAEAETEEEPAEEVPAAVVEQQAATTTRKSLFAS